MSTPVIQWTNRVVASRRVEAWRRHLPGAILSALIAPTLVIGRLTEPLAALATAWVAARTGSLVAALAIGVAVAGGAR